MDKIGRYPIRDLRGPSFQLEHRDVMIGGRIGGRIKEVLPLFADERYGGEVGERHTRAFVEQFED